MNSHTVVGDAGVILQAGGVMAPKLGTPVWSDSGVELKVTADPGVGYWLQSAPDPSAGPWANVTRFTNTTPTEILHDRSAATRQQGYYRAVWP
jgi:hypothetical protein